MTEAELEKIRNILKKRRLSTLKSALGKKHAIDFLLLLHVSRAHHKDAESFMRGLGLPFSDGSYYARMKAFARLGWVKTVPIDPRRSHFEITELGEKVAELLLRFFEQL